MTTIAQAKERILTKWDWENSDTSYPVILWGPPGLGKCIVGNTLVFSNQGLKRIDSFKKDNMVDESYATLSNVSVLNNNSEIVKASHLYFDGIKKTYKIITNHGFEIEGTGKHKVIVFNNHGPQWKRLDEISEDDYIAIIRDPNLLPAGKTPLNLDLSYLLGYFCGDGSFNIQNNKKVGFKITVGKMDIDEFLTNELSSFGTTPTVYRDKKRGAYTVNFSTTYLNYFSQCGSGAINKVVPECVLSGNKNVWKMFLSGLFDSDGSSSYKHGYIEITSKSVELIRTVQIMLTAFGIIAVRKKKQVKYKGEYRTYHKLDIMGVEARKFYNRIGFSYQRKQNNSALLKNNHNSNIDTIPVSESFWKEIRVSAGRLSRLIHKKLYNYKIRGQKPTANKLLNLMSLVYDVDGYAPQHVMDNCNDVYFWDKINSISNSLEEVYDLVVPEGKSFAANGVMNHNTEMVVSLVCERMIAELKLQYYEQVKQIADKESEEYQKLTAELERKLKLLNFDFVSHELLEFIAPHCLVLRLAERPIEQLQGVVVPSMSEKDNFARFVMPENLVRIKETKWGIVFLDELDKASDSKFGAATHILENKVIGDLQLGKGWYVMAAANREEDSHLSNPIPPELRNRCANIEVESDLNTWIKWAVKHNVRKDIILFHKFKNGEWLSNYDLEQTYAFPTPRSWVMASRTIDRLQKKLNPNPDDLKAMEKFNDLVRYELMDFVGKQAQSEFFQYRELYLKFNVVEILDGRKRIATRDNCSNETTLISDQCIAAFAMADQVTPDMLGKKGDEQQAFKFQANKTRMTNLTRFIGDLLPEIRTIYLQQIHTTRIMNIIADSGMADDIMEDIVEYIAAA